MDRRQAARHHWPVAMLVAKNLWRLYEGKPALAGLDLEVEEGSAYGFIGPNGAGKTTTLKILATVDRPDAGRVWIGGKDTQHHTAAVRCDLGFMPDPFHLYNDLTVGQLLMFFAQAYRIPHRERRARVEQSIELTRVGPQRRKKCGSLSKGWRQRVLLAKTLVNDPSVLLLDEPASGLDPVARIEFREIIRALRDLKKTIVVSSHILTELSDFCDAVGIIENGRMLVSGRIEDILARLDPCDRVEIEILGDPERAVTLLEVREEVDSVEQQPSEVPGAFKVTAHLSGRSTPAGRAVFVRLLVEAGLEVAAIGARQEGLEGLFLKVAGKLGKGSGSPLSAELLRTLLAEARAAERGEERGS